MSAELLKALGEFGIYWLHDHFLKDVYGTAEDARWLEKLMQHAMKVLERMVDKRLRDIVDIDGMQFGFIEGKGITYAVWIVKQTQENMLELNNHLGLYNVHLWTWRKPLTAWPEK